MTRTPRRGVASLLPGHFVVHTFRIGWARQESGALLAAAEAAGYEVMLTADQSIRYQQTMTARRIGLVVFSTNSWAVLRECGPQIQEAVGRSLPGSYQGIQLPRPALIRNPPPASKA